MLVYFLSITYLINNLQLLALANILGFGDGVLETDEDLRVELLQRL